MSVCVCVYTPTVTLILHIGTIERVINVLSSSSDCDESDDLVGGDSPLLVLGDHTHHQNKGPSPTCTSMNFWIPLLSHRLFKTLGRSQDSSRRTPRYDNPLPYFRFYHLPLTVDPISQSVLGCSVVG